MLRPMAQPPPRPIPQVEALLTVLPKQERIKKRSTRLISPVALRLNYPAVDMGLRHGTAVAHLSPYFQEPEPPSRPCDPRAAAGTPV